MRIPERMVPGFNLLVALDADQQNKIHEQLTSFGLDSDEDEIEVLLSKSLNISESDASELSNAILALMSLRESYSSTEGLLNILVKALSEEPEINLDNKDAVHGFLSRIIDDSLALRVRIKARRLLYEHDRTLKNTRVLLDARPVFDLEEVPESLQCYIVMNTLRIDYSDNRYASNSSRTITFALDDADLDQLEKSIKKARAKKKILVKKLKDGSGGVLDL